MQKKEREREKQTKPRKMSPIFLPRIVPLPPFDAASASTSRPGGGCCFDAVADAEEALEAQVKE